MLIYVCITLNSIENGHTMLMACEGIIKLLQKTAYIVMTHQLIEQQAIRNKFMMTKTIQDLLPLFDVHINKRRDKSIPSRRKRLDGEGSDQD